MRKTVAVLLTILIFFSLFQGALRENTVKANSQPISGEVELFYTVNVEQDREYVRVEININNLSCNSFNIGFYDASADIHNYIRNLVVDAGENKASVKYISVNTWSVKLQNFVSSLSVFYEISKIVPCNDTFHGVAAESALSVIINNDGGFLAGQNFFIVPLDLKAKKIGVKFNLPDGWQIVCPYIDRGEYYEVPKITNGLVGNFVQRKGIYFGEMKFYSEKQVGNCVVKFGVLKADTSWNTTNWITKQEDVDFLVNRTAIAIEKFTEVFGENPYPVEVIYTCFAGKDNAGNDLNFAGLGVVGAIQYWPEERFDELTGHLLYNWFSFENRDEMPISSISLIGKGLGESFLGCKTAYELTGDKTYLGKFYHYYLVYKRALSTAKYMNGEEIKDRYYRGAVIGLYLDNLIQNETQNNKSIYDIFRYLYDKYKNTGHTVNIQDLEEAVNKITGKSHSTIFNKYVYGDEEIPVETIIQPYKESYPWFLKALDSDAWYKEFHGYAIPSFVDIEMSIPIYISDPSSRHLPFELLCESHFRDFAKYMCKNYDIDKITKEDVETVLSNLTGEDCTGFFERWKDSYGELSLEEMKEWLKSYLPYSPKNLRAKLENDAVTLQWDQVDWRYPSGYYEITGYAIYRGTSPGEEVYISTVTSNSYTDMDIELGITYYYYVKSVENLYQEIPVYSDPSNEVSATVILSYTITTLTSAGGSISPSGAITVNFGDNKSFIITPNAGYKIKDVKVDGASKGPISSYTFSNITSNHTIEATFDKEITQTIIILQIGNKNFTVNGVTKTLDSPPVIKNSRTLLPIRAIVEALGGAVSWDATERKVTVSLGSTTIELWIGKSIAKVNGIDTPIDSTNPKVVPEIINSRTMLPLRFVTENLGCDVQWNGTTKTITITYPKP